jgi:phenylpropionate dioxygenase-like ring-hydroxylating dioxygenase large terminal subunit
MDGSQTDTWQGLRDQLARVDGAFDTSATLPPACYTDPDIFEREAAGIFRASWVGIGRADRWKAPGDYAAFTLAGVPLVVLRDEAGGLRAFANSCRHRGTELLRGEGNCPHIICPFHAWTYGLDGRLAGAPTMNRTQGFDKSDYGLVAFRIEARDGFVFVCFDDDAPSLDDWLGDFSEVHAPWSMEGMVSTRRREFEVACNWKAFIEVFNEYYHLPYVHPETVGDVYDAPDDADKVGGSYASQFGTTQGTGALLAEAQDDTLPLNPALEGRNRQGTRYTWVYPNLTFAAGIDAVWVFETYPLSAGRTRVSQTLCFPQATVDQPDFEARVQPYYERSIALLDEDIPILKQQHAGLASPYARQGRFSHLEPNLAAFAGWYAERLLAD